LDEKIVADEDVERIKSAVIKEIDSAEKFC